MQRVARDRGCGSAAMRRGDAPLTCSNSMSSCMKRSLCLVHRPGRCANKVRGGFFGLDSSTAPGSSRRVPRRRTKPCLCLAKNTVMSLAPT